MYYEKVNIYYLNNTKAVSAEEGPNTRLTSLKIPRNIDTFLTNLMNEKGIGNWSGTLTRCMDDYIESLKLLEQIPGENLHTKIGKIMEAVSKLDAIRMMLESNPQMEKEGLKDLITKYVAYPLYQDAKLQAAEAELQALKQQIKSTKIK